ncbi:kinase-like domain-containing protein [Cercophora scortea]|uniref:non-specific serine/threonine protein kinase n=1 Tax=Cercophora scortea TaxID=314031 RepID=A0AAE0M9F4_9PEZI|nr:kinase-like domain-containing protein [Cercophora scortea]
MSIFLKWMPRLLRRSPSAPRVFSNPNFERISAAQKIEEERFPDYWAIRYYPVRIGEVFVSRYQVVGKLGYGVHSTVWLARDLNEHRHVALKVFVRSQSLGRMADHELNVYNHMAGVSSTSKHPGHDAVRSLLDSFKITGPDGEHNCLVHPPLWDNLKTFLARNPIGRLPTPVLGIVLQRLFLALDFMHTECKLIHTDIKDDNIMFGIKDSSIFEDFEQAELEHPCPRKEVENGRFIYTSRQLKTPTARGLGPPVLCDFGSAVFGDRENIADVQPDLYRAPEIILKFPWSYEIDIWNAGCLIWDLFEGRHMFTGRDPEHHTYRGRAHLASMISILGPPPVDLVARGRFKANFFSEDGKFNAGIELPPPSSLENIETTLLGAEDRAQFMQLVRKMIQWAPENRSTAKQLLEDPWLKAQL